MSKETEQNWINDQIFRAWINRSSAPNKITLYDQLAIEAFHSLPVGPNACEDCQFLYEVKDAYGTGDSPSEFICNGTYKDCPRQDAIGTNIEVNLGYRINNLSDSDLSPLVEALKQNNQFSYASLFVQILMRIEQ